jgi:threonine/homoserine/homoserine lactone efflux protein
MTVEFLLTSLVVVLIPGTGVIYTVSSSIGGGWRHGLFAAIGCTLGIVHQDTTSTRCTTKR